MEHRSQTVRKAKPRAGEERPQLKALTGLRFLAALAVVVDHYWTLFTWWDPAAGMPATIRPQPVGWLQLAHGGGYGVDCFFVLSGFILAYTYVIPDRGLRGSRAAFWVARVARIYPVYLLGLALDAVPFLLFRSHHLGAALAALGTNPLLLQAWVPSLGTWNSWDVPGWSLSAEAFFYLLFPFLVVALARQSSSNLRKVVGLSVGLFAAVPAVLIVLVGTFKPAWWWWLDQILYFNPLLRVPEFTLGLALGILFVRRHQRPARRVVSSGKLTIWDAALVALGLTLAGLQFVPLPPHYPVSVLMLPLLAVAILLLAEQRGAIAQVLAWRGCVWLGEISYAVYILHAPIWSWLAWAGQHWFHRTPATLAFFPIYVAIVLAAAAISYRFVERPGRRAIRARWAAWDARRHVGQTATAPADHPRRPAAAPRSSGSSAPRPARVPAAILPSSTASIRERAPATRSPDATRSRIGNVRVDQGGQRVPR